MPKYFPSSGINFLLHAFNLSWSLHSFPSIWWTSFTVSIHLMGKPLDSSAFFRSIFLSPVSQKLFERIILSRLLFFLKCNSIRSLFPRAEFHSERSTLDQILFYFQSTSDGLNKPKPSSRTIRATIDFSTAIDSVWRPALFHKLISADLTPCTQSFLSDRRAWVIFQNHRSRSFRVRRGVPQVSVLGPVLFSFFNNIHAFPSSSVS